MGRIGKFLVGAVFGLLIVGGYATHNEADATVRSNGVNTGNISVTGGTIANTTASGTTNIVFTPTGGVSAIPFIHLSSGTVSAVGAISAITALPLAYPSAYCWFPANALATSIAAGWYYCTFSSTTAGTAFLNTYSSGAPSIPSSPTAVTDGKGAFASDTASHNGPTIAVPGNSLGPNGRIRVQALWAYTNSAGLKTTGFTFGGTTFLASAQSTSLYIENTIIVANTGATNAQIGETLGMTGGGSVTGGGAPALGTLDTTGALNAVFPLVKNTAADNLILNRYSIEVMYAP